MKKIIGLLAMFASCAVWAGTVVNVGGLVNVATGHGGTYVGVGGIGVGCGRGGTIVNVGGGLLGGVGCYPGPGPCCPVYPYRPHFIPPPPPVVYAPAPVVYAPAPVVYAAPAPVVVPAVVAAPATTVQTTTVSTVVW